MIRLRQSENDLLLDFDDYEDYDSFDEIIEKLKKQFRIHITEQIDGPESRVWRFRLEDREFSLHNNPYGNYLKASTESSKAKLKEILPIMDFLF
ncbi:MAG TPA: DUF3630 family protein [Cytophagaceae bacterium]